jgi:hypothetical protein
LKLPIKLHFSGDDAGIAVDLELIQQIGVRLCYGISHPDNNININNFRVPFLHFCFFSIGNYIFVEDIALHLAEDGGGGGRGFE